MAKSTITYTKGREFKVKLKGKVLKDTISLYLEYYQGYEMKDGKPHPKVKKEFLKIYLKQVNKTAADRADTKEKEALAHKIRTQRENDMLYSDAGMINPDVRKTDYMDYMNSYISKLDKKKDRQIIHAVNKFKEFYKEDRLPTSRMTSKLVVDFKKHLLNSFNGYTPNNILKNFKKILKQATADGLFKEHPGYGISCPEPTDVRKDVLIYEEIDRLMNTPMTHDQVCKAWTFCLCTGVRGVDVLDLRWEEIQDGILKLDQSKTKVGVIVDLNKRALSCLGDRGEPKELVFELPGLGNCNKHLGRWIKKAGISKNITWHCARHTFATRLLGSGADLNMVRTLLGHTTFKHTQKYLHINNKERASAVANIDF